MTCSKSVAAVLYFLLNDRKSLGIFVRDVMVLLTASVLVTFMVPHIFLLPSTWIRARVALLGLIFWPTFGSQLGQRGACFHLWVSIRAAVFFLLTGNVAAFIFADFFTGPLQHLTTSVQLLTSDAERYASRVARNSATSALKATIH